MHCGEGKTGSSSIQMMLKSSNKKLMENNILYYSMFNNGHFDFSYIVGKRHRVPKDRDKLILDRVKNTVTKIKNLANEHQPNFIILSSESFFGLTHDEIKKTINYLGIEFTDIYCIVYVRCPVDYYLSVTQQKIKASHIINNPFTFKRNIAAPLITWQKFVGPSNFIGAVFDRKTLSQGDVVVDFIEKLEEITQKKIGINEWSTVNESITAEQMILLQEYRLNFLSDYNNQFMPSSSKLLNLFLASNTLKKLGTKPELRHEIKDAILFNNKEYIVGVDNILTENSKTNLCGFFEKSYSSVSWNEKYITSVEDILSSYDKEFYRILKSILIEYNESLKLGCEDYLSIFNDDKKSREMAAKIYFNYLKSNNYFSSAQLKDWKKMDVKDYGKVLSHFLI